MRLVYFAVGRRDTSTLQQGSQIVLTCVITIFFARVSEDPFFLDDGARKQTVYPVRQICTKQPSKRVNALWLLHSSQQPTVCVESYVAEGSNKTTGLAPRMLASTELSAAPARQHGVLSSQDARRQWIRERVRLKHNVPGTFRPVTATEAAAYLLASSAG